MTDETIFAAALEKADPAERSAYLDTACLDGEQRQRIDALLAAHEKASSFLERPAVSPPDPSQAPTRAFRDPRAEPGDGVTRTHGAEADDDRDDALAFLDPPGRPDSLGRLGHYEVLEILGKGGFGIVFRTFDELLQRVVAVKVLAPSMAATSPARKRFLREARSSAAVRHENVVQVHAVEEKPLPYLVMEFIPGETLQQRLDRIGPIEVIDVLRLARQIAEGLAAAHATGLIHRDIKPSNILIDSGPQQQVKITDFGLARAADDASLTRSGVVAGTPMYMAPEQAKGESLDHRADLFSLGSVMYAMLTGRPPFRATTTLAVLKRVAEDDPRPIREVIPEVPEWLCRIVEKLHAKDPEDRFESAREVADVLADCERQLQSHGGVKDFSRIPEADSPPPPEIEWWKWAAGAVAVVACLVFVPIVIYTLFQSVGDGGHVEPARGPTTQSLAWGDVVDPLGDCRFTESNGRLTIAVPGGGRHDLNPRPGWDLNAPRVVRDVEGDFEVSVVLPPFPKPEPGASARGDGTVFLGAGLVVWANDSHFLRLFRCSMPKNRDGAPYVQAEWFTDRPEQPQKASYIGEGPVHLRVRRNGPNLQLLHSPEGRTWTELTTVTDLPMGARVRVGVAAVSTVNREFVASFEEFQVKPQSATSPAESGWMQLFNGKDLTGWESGKKSGAEWTVEDGAIVGRKGPGYLFSKKFYENFHVRVEARLSAGGNGGVSFREGFQTEIRNDPQCPTGSILRIGPAKTDIAARYPRPAVPADEWFTLEIRAIGPSLSTRINDGPWVAAVDDRPEQDRSGPLSLETSAHTTIHFRKIEIQELHPAEKTAPMTKAPEAVLQPLRDIVLAKEKSFETTKLRFEAGILTKIDLLKAGADLTEARIKLAEAEGDEKALIARLEELVRQREEERDLIRERVEAGILGPEVLNDADARAADVRARLGKVKPTAPPEPAPAPRPKP